MKKRTLSPAQRAALAKGRLALAAKRARAAKRTDAAKTAPAARPTATKIARRKTGTRGPKKVVKVVFTPKGRPTTVKAFAAVRRKRPGRKGRSYPRVKHYRHRTTRKVLHLNPPALAGFLQPIRDYGDNLRGSVRSAGGVVALVGGAVGSVMAGTMVRRVIANAADQVAPGFAAGPIGSRLLPFLSYYLAGWAIARFVPMRPATRKAVLAGAITAGVFEVIRPGLVQETIAKIPMIGPMIAGQMARTMGEYAVGEYAVGEYAVGNVAYEDGAAIGASNDLDPMDIGCAAPIDAELVSDAEEV